MDKPKGKKSFKGNQKFRTHSVTNKQVKVIRPIKNGSDEVLRMNEVWNLYVPDKSYEEFAHFSCKLKAIENYFSEIDSSSLKSISENNFYKINVSNILKNKMFISTWPDFMSDLENSPKLVVGLFGFSMDQLIKKKCIQDYDDDVTYDNSFIPLKMNPRFIGLQNYLPFHDLKMHKYGKFVTLIGTVVRVSEVKPFCICMAFMCAKCQTIQVVIQNKGCYTTPSMCIGKGCFCHVFKPLLNSTLTQTVPLKNIRLQELNTDNTEGGRVPRTVECELTCDLTDSCMPGDTVIITGIVGTSDKDEQFVKRKGAFGSSIESYVLHIKANSVICLKGKNVDSVDLSPEILELKTEDLGAIQKIHSENNLFRLVVSSLCPNIYGHELIKAGLVLGLFGGRDRTHEDKNKEFSIRENSHILIVGDPGLGKSQMLLACTNASPRGVYVCGNSTTSSGLTVTISKEGGGENSLEAGALVLADQGHCCIDEFDKMMHQHSALLEAMEQQTISIAKSGVVCTLPARTSILAAANPSGGHYNKAKTVSENLKIGGSLLSRFDLVFIVQDDPDQELDQKMSKHVMGLHTLKNQECRKDSFSSYFSSINSLEGDNRLLKKLKLEPNEILNFIPHAMLQKYISYARKFAQPKITPEVAKILQDFYLDMRKQHKLSNTMPITTRQLESLIRLTEARARIELRAFCTNTDAEEVIEIMKYSMRETYSDEYGNFDFNRSIHGSGMSKSAKSKKLINMMTKIASERGDDCFTKSEIQQLGNKLNITADSLYSIVESLNEAGFILKKGHKLYQLQTL